MTRTFSLPSLKRSITAALCSTCISPLSSATWWPSLDSSPASQPAVFLVWNRESNHFNRELVYWSETFHKMNHHHHLMIYYYYFSIRVDTDIRSLVNNVKYGVSQARVPTPLHLVPCWLLCQIVQESYIFLLLLLLRLILKSKTAVLRMNSHGRRSWPGRWWWLRRCCRGPGTSPPCCCTTQSTAWSCPVFPPLSSAWWCWGRARCAGRNSTPTLQMWLRRATSGRLEATSWVKKQGKVSIVKTDWFGSKSKETYYTVCWEHKK